MTKEYRDAFLKLCDKATPGPWEIDTYENNNRVTVGTLESSQRHILNWVYLADAVFIATARQDVPALLEALEEAEADRDRWKARAIRAESDYEKASNHATNLTRHVKALERALEVEKTCMTCEYVDCDTGDEPCCRCDRGQGVHDCWILDKARFSGGEENVE